MQKATILPSNEIIIYINFSIEGGNFDITNCDSSLSSFQSYLFEWTLNVSKVFIDSNL